MLYLVGHQVGEDEIFDQENFIKMFNPDRLSKSPAAI